MNISLGFNEEVQGIYRLKVPFEKIYTSVFLIKTNSGTVLVDCATTEKDIDEHIIPALKAMGYTLSELSAIVLSHSHADHAGGLERVLQLAPNIEVITDIRALDDKISTYALSGHTIDSIGVLDEHTHTLISGDGLQGAGVDKYPCYTQDPQAYLQTLKRIRNDERIENILFSHAYEPWGRENMLGRENIKRFLGKCVEYVKL